MTTLPARRVPDAERARLPILRTRAEALAARLARVEAVQHRPDPIAAHFHLGRVGGSGRNVAGLNRKRSADLDRTIDRALEIGRMKERLASLNARIRAIENAPPPGTPAPPKPRAPRERVTATAPPGSPLISRSEWRGTHRDYRGTLGGAPSVLYRTAAQTGLTAVEIVPDDSPRLLTEPRIERGRLIAA